MFLAEGVIAAVVALLVLIMVLRSVRIVPQARARNVERFGRYRKTLEPGMNFIIPGIEERQVTQPSRDTNRPRSGILSMQEYSAEWPWSPGSSG